MQTQDPKVVKFLEKLKDIKSVDELTGKNGLITDLVKDTLQTLLEAEMTNHLGYPKHLKILAPGATNKRNGSYSKKIKTGNGEAELAIPRDRDGDFQPQIVPKHQTTTSELDQKIISMYAKGMTLSDINEHLADMYGVALSDTMLSAITDKIIPQIQEWQNRPLAEVYPVVFLDAIHFKVRSDGVVKNMAAYLVFAIDIDGKKDVLGCWLGEEEGARFWLSVLTDLKNRGLKDILILCCDNLTGFSEAIGSCFPNTIIQKCVIHQIRNSLKYILSKDQKAFLSDLKTVYKATTKDQAETNLLNLAETWGKKYPMVIKSWEKNWSELSAYFAYTSDIRKLIYTTNAIEGLNRQIRKVTKNKALFPTRLSLEKMLWLAIRDIRRRMTMPVQNWAQIISQLHIHFPDRFKLPL